MERSQATVTVIHDGSVLTGSVAALVVVVVSVAATGVATDSGAVGATGEATAAAVSVTAAASMGSAV